MFSNPPPTQCTATATCIDHPPTIDLSRIAGALPGNPSPSSVDNVPIPAHDHVVGTRNSGQPEWWNVEVVATTDPATFATLTSTAAITAAVNASTAIEAPTNASLFFQVLPGTVPAAQAADLTATAPPGAPVATAPDPNPAVNQTEAGTTFNNLKNDCGATAPNCQNLGISRDWIDGQDVEALYTEQYFCDATVSAASDTKCEAGAAPNHVPPGVADQHAAVTHGDQRQHRPAVHPGAALRDPAGAVRPVPGSQHLHRPPGHDRPLDGWRRRSASPTPRRWTTSACPDTTTC